MIILCRIIGVEYPQHWFLLRNKQVVPKLSQNAPLLVFCVKVLLVLTVKLAVRLLFSENWCEVVLMI